MLKQLEKLLNRKRPVIGIDIGDSSVKLVEITKHENSVKLLHIGRVGLPPGCLHEGSIADSERFAQALAELIAVSGTKSKDVVIGLNGKNIIIRQVRLPLMPEKELRQAVEWEAEKYLPIQKQDLHIDYINFGEIQNGPNKQLNVLVAAAPKDMLYSYYEVFSKVGLDIIAIDILPLALWHAVVRDVKTNNPAEPVAILDLGAETSTIVMYRNEKLQFTRSIPIGGNDLNKSIGMMLAISEEEAEKLKEQFGITAPEEEMMGFPEDPAEKLQFAIKGSLRELAQEIRRSINFYQVQDREAQIIKILLVGGMANLVNIERYISKELGISVEIHRPNLAGTEHFPDFTKLGKGLRPSFVVAYGLARREVEE